MLLISCLLTAALNATDADSRQLQRYREVRPSMGSTFEITLYAPDDQTAREGFEAAFGRIEQVNAIFSDYDSDSECSRLSRAAPLDEPVTVSPEMWTVLSWSRSLAARSEGAFDVTVGPLTKLWRRARRQHRLPDQDRLEQALAAVGYQHIRLEHETRRVALTAAGMRLDFGGVAKGFAGDEALRALHGHGISRALINGGGDVTLGQPPPGADGWRIGVAPLDPSQPSQRILELSDCAVATSGDAWQYVEIDGVRYSHIVDPHTGLGLTRRSGVTVIARDGLTADSLASAVSVLGPQRGIDLVDQICCAACLVVQVEAGQPRTYASNGFAALKAAAEPTTEDLR
jgi:thiamine biosynthesis lipoprotein